MKTRSLIACVLLLAVLLTACAASATDLPALVDQAVEQFDKPLGDAYKTLGLPGDPAAETHYLYAEDSTKIFGKSFATYVIYLGSKEKEDVLADLPTHCIEYGARMDGDLDYVIKLRDALTEAYGAPPPMEDLPEGIVDLADATAESLAGLTDSEDAWCVWELGGNKLQLLFHGRDDVLTFSIESGSIPKIVPNGTPSE